ncbi:MAG: DsrE family protein [Gallionella sp.]
MDESEQAKLLILWTSGDREVALNMMTMYARNSIKNGWWEHISLILWGPSQRLFINDPEVRSEVEELQKMGVRVMACVACADKYGLTEALRSTGVEVFGMGPVLTNWLKSGNRTITL